ncbi:MAG TPA: GDSL-type esterase/lipase family protein [Verrucomicrobiae bacterium]|jgi:lysophospholipase L1-like esterase|nr:GDSL-type esterase/lipase family protein [Verrucomicrobiae bacterium]
MKIHLPVFAIAFGLLLAVQQLSAQSPDVSTYPTNTALLPGKGPASKWGGLPKVWAARHAEWAKTADNDHNAVVFLGDSITENWKTLPQDFPDLKVANRGISGDTTRGVLYRLNADVLSLDPKAIVLLIGTNDVGNGADPREVSANIKEILKRVRKKYPKMPVIVCEVMPSSEKQHRPAATIEKLNALIKKDVNHKSNYLCDTWSIYAQADGDCPQDEFPDLLHPNASGYAKWIAALKPLLAKLNLTTTGQGSGSMP